MEAISSYQSNMPKYIYKVTVAFSWPNWTFIRSQVFGDSECVFSQTSDSEPAGIFGFDTPQTPIDLGPLVKVEIVPSSE